ncbi:MAG: SAM hydrolase/SAM-dependent halogenase family protein [Candidatus Krumholzibacteriia bacterium]
MIRTVTLLTDFGLADPYVAEMKGALLAEWCRFPDSWPLPPVIDLSHALRPGDVAGAAWLLGRVAPTFPAGTVHLAVVDPGVGTDRPAVAAAAGGQLFVGPGNGLFAFLARRGPVTVVRLDNPLYHRGRGGVPAPTFHGRDLFAPAAAQLAMGVPLAQLGSPVGPAALGGAVGEDGERDGAPDATGAAEIGRIVWIDRFGNAITDVARDGPHGAWLTAGATVTIDAVGAAGPEVTFAAGPPERPFWYWGSGDTLEIALRGGDASARHGWQVGMAVRRSRT